MKYKKLFFAIIIVIPPYFYITKQNSKKLRLRIISYNINSEIDWSQKKDKITKILKSFNADIICLQEVAHKDHARELSKELNLHWNENAWHEGQMTILCKTPILQYLVIDVPDSYYNALVAIKTTPDIWVASIHLWSKDYKIDDSERIYELTFILKKLKELNAKKIIIAGDFNSLDNTKVSKLLEQKGYIDTHKNKTWSKGTWMPANYAERIDRIHFKGDFKILNGKVIDHNDFNWLRPYGWPSGNDHRLVLTDLE